VCDADVRSNKVVVSMPACAAARAARVGDRGGGGGGVRARASASLLLVLVLAAALSVLVAAASSPSVSPSSSSSSSSALPLVAQRSAAETEAYARAAAAQRTDALSADFGLFPEHACVHDSKFVAVPRAQREVMVMQPPPAPAEARADAEARSGSSIGLRLVVDTSKLLGDAHTCYATGDTYTLGNGAGDCNSVSYNCQGTCLASDVLTDAKRTYIQNTIMPAASDWFRLALSKRNAAANDKVVLNTGVTCPSSSAAGYDPLTIPSSYASPGVSGDMVLFVTARPIRGLTIAYAATCQIDSTTWRPTGGFINFGPGMLSTAAIDFNSMLTVGVHEMSHAIGFSYDKFSTFWNPTTNQHVAQSQVVGSDSFTGMNSASYTRSLIITSSVKSKTQAHFGCSTIVGAQLEDGGGAGTTLSHWDKRQFYNEFMTGSIGVDPVRSQITLALFEDSGWYLANYTVVGNEFIWGKDKGCNFYNKPCTCNTPSSASDCNWPGPGYTCSVSSAEGCTFDFKYKGACNKITYSSALPSYWQYFASPLQGGAIALADYCAFTQPYSTGASCEESANLATSSYGETYQPGSRCMMSTLAQNSATPPSSARARCYTVSCLSTTSLSVTVGSQSQTCTTEGATLTFSGYTGTITCPSPAAVCAFVDGPSFTSISPSVATDRGGVPVTILGGSFVGSNPSVTLGGVACTSVDVVTTSQLTCVTGASLGTNAAVDVVLTFGGRAVAAPGAFTYSTSAPYILYLTPSSGPFFGSRSVQVVGGNFASSGSSVPALLIGAASCTNVTVLNSTHATAVTPSFLATLSNTSTANVLLTDKSGTASYRLQGYTVDFAWPWISSTVPNGGPLTGGAALAIFGSGYTSPMTVTIGGASCSPVTVSSSTRMLCMSPAHAAASGLAVSVSDSQSRGDTAQVRARRVCARCLRARLCVFALVCMRLRACVRPRG
jgi:leishmanolysin-like peptidase